MVQSYVIYIVFKMYTEKSSTNILLSVDYKKKQQQQIMAFKIIWKLKEKGSSIKTQFGDVNNLENTLIIVRKIFK